MKIMSVSLFPPSLSLLLVEASLVHILTDKQHPDYPNPLCIAQCNNEHVDMPCFAAGIDKRTSEYDHMSQMYNSEVHTGAGYIARARPE